RRAGSWPCEIAHSSETATSTVPETVPAASPAVPWSVRSPSTRTQPASTSSPRTAASTSRAARPARRTPGPCVLCSLTRAPYAPTPPPVSTHFCPRGNPSSRAATNSYVRAQLVRCTLRARHGATSSRAVRSSKRCWIARCGWAGQGWTWVETSCGGKSGLKPGSAPNSYSRAHLVRGTLRVWYGATSSPAGGWRLAAGGWGWSAGGGAGVRRPAFGVAPVAGCASPSPLLRGEELVVGELAVQRRGVEELGVRAGRDHAAAVEHDDLVAVDDGRQPVRDHQQGAAGR